MKDIAIYGAGGFGREVACLINRINTAEPTWHLIGFFDDTPEKKGQAIAHYGPCFGGIDELNRWPGEIALAIAIGNPSALENLSDRITNPNVYFPNIIAPDVIFLDRDDVKLGKGNIICSSCLLSCNVTIGDFNILNGFIPVGHDAIIGNYNVIMPSTNISGGVSIGNLNFFGVKATVLQGLKVGDNVRIGANSVIIRNTKDNNLYLGNPATIVKL